MFVPTFAAGEWLRLLLWPAAARAIGLRQAPERPIDGGNALDDGGTRRGNLPLLERDHGQRLEYIEELARMQQKIGVSRPPEPLVAETEGFINENPSRRERLHDVREQRPVQVICHDDARISGAERPGCAGFRDRSARTSQPAAASGSKAETSRSTARTAKPLCPQQARMPAGPGGQIEHQASRPDQRQKTLNPGGRSLRGLGSLGRGRHIGEAIADAADPGIQLPARRWCR